MDNIFRKLSFTRSKEKQIKRYILKSYETGKD